METLKLMERIAEKGGLMAACAKLYVNDQEKAAQFLKECQECCHTALAEKYWGEELVKDIIKHNLNGKTENYKVC